MSPFDNLGLSRAQLQEHVESLPRDEREELFVLIRALDERTYWQFHPVEWISKFCEIPMHTLVWSQNRGYLESGRVRPDGTLDPEKWDGTPDPIVSMLEALASWENVAMPSGTGTGKTFTAAAAILWFMANFRNSKVIFTAPKKDLVERNLWGEITALYETAKANGAFSHVSTSEEPQKTHLQIRMDPDGRLRESWIAFGVVAAVGAEEEAAAKMQGYHAEHMLIVLDEAVGLDGAIIAAAQNTSTAPHNLRLALGNPNSTTDNLAEFARGRNVRLVTVSGYDHPNVVGNDPESDLRYHHQTVPGAVSWGSILDRRQQYGPEPEAYNAHPLYQSRVRGLFPTGSVHSLFTPAAIRAITQHQALPRIGIGTVREALDAYALPLPDSNGLTVNVFVPAPTPEVTFHTNKPGTQERLEGETRIYYPVEHTHVDRYLISADVAGDVAGGDAHAAIVYDRIMRRVAAVIHMRGHRRYYALELLRLANLYRVYDWQTETFHAPLMVWERNAGGALHLVPEFSAYVNLYQPRAVDRPKEGKPQNRWGWYTSASSRMAIIEELEDWGLELRLFPQRVPDTALLGEMTTFEWNEKKKRYEHRTGQHDDLVMALGIGLVVSVEMDDPRQIPDDPGVVARGMGKLLRDMQKATREAQRASYGNRFDTADTSRSSWDKGTRRSGRGVRNRNRHWE